MIKVFAKDALKRESLARRDGEVGLDNAKNIHAHSKLIRRLRLLLPGVIIGLILINFSWISIQSILNRLSVPKAGTEEIRMTNPRFQGQSDSKERYEISGLEAVRQHPRATLLFLTSPQIDLKGKADKPVRLAAQRGQFDEVSNLFYLKGKVLIKGGDSDFEFRTEEATLDLNKSVVHGDKPVEAIGPMGHIYGQSFMISESGNRIEFKGKGEAQVQTQIDNKQTNGPKVKQGPLSQ
jgi:lipopolysaccharide export system protein LptC